MLQSTKYPSHLQIMSYCTSTLWHLITRPCRGGNRCSTVVALPSRPLKIYSQAFFALCLFAYSSMLTRSPAILDIKLTFLSSLSRTLTSSLPLNSAAFSLPFSSLALFFLDICPLLDLFFCDVWMDPEGVTMVAGNRGFLASLEGCTG